MDETLRGGLTQVLFLTISNIVGYGIERNYWAS